MYNVLDSFDLQTSGPHIVGAFCCFFTRYKVWLDLQDLLMDNSERGIDFYIPGRCRLEGRRG